VYFNHELYIADGKAVKKETCAFEALSNGHLNPPFIQAAGVLRHLNAVLGRILLTVYCSF
jgi:hypothetical protein